MEFIRLCQRSNDMDSGIKGNFHHYWQSELTTRSVWRMDIFFVRPTALYFSQIKLGEGQANSMILLYCSMLLSCFCSLYNKRRTGSGVFC